MGTVAEALGCRPANPPDAQRRLLEAAAKYIFQGTGALDPEALAQAQGEVACRMALAGSVGLRERDVVRAILRPLFSSQSHCRCPSCQESCVICRSIGCHASDSEESLVSK